MYDTKDISLMIHIELNLGYSIYFGRQERPSFQLRWLRPILK